MKKWMALLHFIRIIFVFSPGMVHPDEYFQCPEIMATNVFKLKHTFIPWEWDVNDPNRSVLFPGLVAGLPYMILQKWTSSPSPEWLLYLPRFIMLALSFVAEYWIGCVAHRSGVDANKAKFVYASSWTTIVLASRTFSNTMETFWLALAYYVVLRKHACSTRKCIMLGVVLGLGTFTRFAFIFFFFPVGVLLIMDQDANWRKRMEKKETSIEIYHRCMQCLRVVSFGALGFCMTALPCILMDTVYFRPHANLFDFQSWVFAPWNNLMYNMNPKNLELHGTHARYIHSLVNMPLLFGPAVLAVCFKVKARFLPTAGIVVPLTLLSIAPHQEARFLLPLIMPLSILASDVQMSSRLKKYILMMWVLFNTILSIFYGHLHQAGIIPLLLNMSQNNERQYVAFAKSYMPPRFLTATAVDNENSMYIQDFAGRNVKLEPQLHRLLHKFYMVLPGTVPVHDVIDSCTIVSKTQYWPHISTENLPTRLNELYADTSLFAYELSNCSYLNVNVDQ